MAANIADLPECIEYPSLFWVRLLKFIQSFEQCSTLNPEAVNNTFDANAHLIRA
jgi:hypothetical protein